LGVTLPSEAEWERAARGDEDGRIYPWGDQADPNCANYRDTGIGTTSAVGAFPDGASPYGLLDLSGNVYEWTRTIWDSGKYPYPYHLDDGRESLEKESRKARRVLRGGAFFNDTGALRCAFRDRSNPDVRISYGGFRVCVSPSARSEAEGHH
jgi:formylglycine-generating enzyme required for sulfatase activity